MGFDSFFASSSADCSTSCAQTPRGKSNKHKKRVAKFVAPKVQHRRPRKDFSSFMKAIEVGYAYHGDGNPRRHLVCRLLTFGEGRLVAVHRRSANLVRTSVAGRRGLARDEIVRHHPPTGSSKPAEAQWPRNRRFAHGDVSESDTCVRLAVVTAWVSPRWRPPALPSSLSFVLDRC